MKKLIVFTLTLVFVLSLTACGRAAGDVTSGVESMTDSVVSGTQSAADRATSGAESTANRVTSGTESAASDKSSMELMAGITANDAKRAALKHAGIDESQARDIDVDLDRDNGKLIYEVDFNSGSIEYDYDIDAETGAVISADKSKD